MFGPPEGKAQAGAQLTLDLLQTLEQPVPAAVQAGPDSTFTGRFRRNLGAQAIIDAVSADDDLPLTLVCAGPLTNVADALLEAPDIAPRFKLAWVGGSSTGSDHDEYNYFTDPMAAQFVLAYQQLDIDQFPLDGQGQGQAGNPRDVELHLQQLRPTGNEVREPNVHDHAPGL